MAEKIRILYAEDKPLYRKMIVEELSVFNVECIGEANNGLELLELLRAHTVDLVLLDLEMPMMDGNTTMKEIMVRFPETKILVISLHLEHELINDYLNRGAKGYIGKDTICGDIFKLKEAIQRIHNGEVYIDNSTLTPRIFTARQVEIIPLICDELTNKEIASRLGINERTVERQRNKIYKRSNSSGSTSFLKYAFKRGLDLLEKKTQKG
jgi:two-component system, NarL family, nitrate/nitrite response regulator NarL